MNVFWNVNFHKKSGGWQFSSLLVLFQENGTVDIRAKSCTLFVDVKEKYEVARETENQNETVVKFHAK